MKQEKFISAYFFNVIFKIVIVLFFCLSWTNQILAEEGIVDIQHSRKSTVQISSSVLNSSGSGTLFNDEYIITAFHVIAKISSDGSRASWNIATDLTVTFHDGEKIEADCVSFPSETELQPLRYDFAILKLRSKPKNAWQSVSLTDRPENIEVGDEVIFSGYPLATPGMVTHMGMISGFDNEKNLIFIQAPINKGNSGGMVLNQAGQGIGIISMREGGISRGLADLTDYIEKTSGSGSVRIMGVDPLQSTRAIIQTLDKYISTGIGYARAYAF
jgi:S1-C subfamily serine protease